ncbi:MAG: potassium transporter TrkA [Proteobacteria bacterium]|nr:MAG: potassium transporter TrkA [Pseudomonadota bacterium]
MSTHEYQTSSARRRLVVALGLIVMVYATGTIGYYLLGGGEWSLGDCAYMTVISITTVGYGEILQRMQSVPYARLFTSLLLVSGAGVALYAVSMLTTFLVEGEFLDIRRRRRMDKRISKMNGHIIVCGAGRTGMHVIAELSATHWPFVVIDTDEHIGARCREACGKAVDFMIGDAIDDHVLLNAGIERAYGVVAGLPEDKDNLYVVLTARGMNPKLRIIAKAVDPRAENKLRVAGADSVVSVNRIGGMRLASEMIRPSVVTFLDVMLRDKDKNLRFEEIAIPPGSSLIGRRLADSDIRKERKLLVVAVTGPEEEVYTYSPGPDFELQEGMTLVLIGETESVRRLRELPAFNPS